MNLTRRDATKLVLAGSALALPLPASAAPNRELGARLQRDLRAALKPGCDGRFTVIGFGQGRLQNGNIAYVAGVELSWPPGMRRRRFDASASTEEGAYQLLLATALSHFRKAWTYPDGRTCVA